MSPEVKDEIPTTDVVVKSSASNADSTKPVPQNFGWVEIQGLNTIPYIIRNEESYVANNILASNKFFMKTREQLSALTIDCFAVTSIAMTKLEAIVFNEINVDHCDRELVGTYQFQEGDTMTPVPTIKQMVKFYDACQKSLILRHIENDLFGFLKIADNDVPFIWDDGHQFVPFFYFDGFLDELEKNAVVITDVSKLSFFKFCFLVQMIREEHYTRDSLKVVDIVIIRRYFPSDAKFPLSWPKNTNPNLLVSGVAVLPIRTSREIHISSVNDAAKADKQKERAYNSAKRKSDDIATTSNVRRGPVSTPQPNEVAATAAAAAAVAAAAATACASKELQPYLLPQQTKNVKNLQPELRPSHSNTNFSQNQNTRLLELLQRNTATPIPTNSQKQQYQQARPMRQHEYGSHQQNIGNNCVVSQPYGNLQRQQMQKSMIPHNQICQYELQKQNNQYQYYNNPEIQQLQNTNSMMQHNQGREYEIYQQSQRSNNVASQHYNNPQNPQLQNANLMTPQGRQYEPNQQKNRNNYYACQQGNQQSFVQFVTQKPRNRQSKKNLQRNTSKQLNKQSHQRICFSSDLITKLSIFFDQSHASLDMSNLDASFHNMASNFVSHHNMPVTDIPLIKMYFSFLKGIRS